VHINFLRAAKDNYMVYVAYICERGADAIGTLSERYVRSVNGKFDVLGTLHANPTARYQIFRALYKLCGISVWGLSIKEQENMFECVMLGVKGIFFHDQINPHVMWADRKSY